LSGELPKELGYLVNLMYFNASLNKFQGKSYAPATCVVCLLTFSFEGELPKELGNLVNLIYLYLNNNEFEGEFVCSVLHLQLWAMHLTEFLCVIVQ